MNNYNQLFQLDSKPYIYVACYLTALGFPDGSDGKELPAMQDTWVRSLGQEDPLKKGMATHSSILAWRIPWTEEPGRLQSVGRRELDMTERLSIVHSTSYDSRVLEVELKYSFISEDPFVPQFLIFKIGQ